MITKIRAVVLTLTTIAVAAAGLLIGAGTSNATTVQPHWNRAVCPSNIKASNDVLCYWAYDGLSWVAMHVSFDSTTQHDRARANGFVGQSNLAGIVCVNDSNSGKSSCTDLFQRGPFVTGYIPDGPANSDYGELDLFNHTTRVSRYTTTSF